MTISEWIDVSHLLEQILRAVYAENQDDGESEVVQRGISREQLAAAAIGEALSEVWTPR